MNAHRLSDYPTTYTRPLIAWLTCLFVALAIPASLRAADYRVPGTNITLTYTVNGSTATITDCDDDASGPLVIPASIGGIPVTSIGIEAFYGCRNTTSVTLPASVTSIGEYAFLGCSGEIIVDPANPTYASSGGVLFSKTFSTLIQAPGALSGHYTIPSNVTSIGKSAFDGSRKLTSITIPSGVTSIGEYAFAGCSRLTSVSIPSGVTAIGDYTFKGCACLTSLSLPASLTSIGAYAFEGCEGLTSLSLPASLTSIGVYAFHGCAGLINLSLPASLTSIGAQAFLGCTGLTSVSIPPHVTVIGDDAFSYCSKLTAITVDPANSGFASTGGVLFNKAFTTLLRAPGGLAGAYTIPSSVTSIRYSAFEGCSRLTGVAIPASVTSIGQSVFSNCSGLTSITIPSRITSIPYAAFTDCSRLTSISIPASVTSIGEFAFMRCTALPTISIPAKVTRIGDSAFNDCHALTSVSIPTGVTSIGETTFYGCYALASVSIPPSVTSIGKSAFFDCHALTSVSIPTGVTSIGTSAFAGCSRLTSVSIPAQATSIGDNAFYGCSGLTAITVDSANPSYASSSGVLFNKAFTTLLQAPGGLAGAYTIPSSVTSIGEAAFARCSGLTSISIPDSVTSIGRAAFSDCVALTNVSIPRGVTFIGDFAFDDCARLTAITVDSANPSYASSSGVLFNKTFTTLLRAPGALAGAYTIPTSVTSIGDYAFGYCSGLTSISIPRSTTSIGFRAFYRCSGLTAFCVDSSNPAYTSAGGVLFNKESTTLLKAPGALAGPYTIPSGVTSIDFLAFEECSGLTNVSIPSSVTSIGDSAFEYCSGLTNVSIPSSVTSIGSGAFSDCSGLTSISIPPSVTSIGSSAFSYCSGLTSISIPSSVTSIGDFAFDCSSLTSATFEGNAPNMHANVFYSAVSGFTIYYPSDATGFTAPTWKGFPAQPYNRVSQTITFPLLPDRTYGDAPFALTATASSGLPVYFAVVSGPATVSGSTLILTGAGTVTIRATQPGNATYAPAPSVERSFTVLAGHFSFSTNNGAVTITGYTGPGGPVAIPAQLGGLPVTSIDDEAFEDCSSLTSVSIPSSVTSIGDAAFAGCSGLTSVTIPSSVTSIGGGAFALCPALFSVTVDASNSSYASLDGVLFDKSLHTLIQAPGALSGIYTIPFGVISIGEGAFAQCSGLTRVSIPSSVTSIGDYAFAWCSALARVTFNGNAPNMDSSVFSSSATDFTIYYPSLATGFSTPTWQGFPALPYDDGRIRQTFASWIAATGLSGLDAAPTADPDADGLANLLEFALGGSPTVADNVTAAPSVTLGTSAGQPALVLTHRRRKAAAVTIIYQQTANLADNAGWTPVALTPEVIDPDVEGDGLVERVRVALPLGTQSRLFLRISASE